MAAEMMSGDLPVTSDADAVAKQKAKEAELAAGGTMLASGSTKRKADQVRTRSPPPGIMCDFLQAGPPLLETNPPSSRAGHYARRWKPSFLGSNYGELSALLWTTKSGRVAWY